MMSKFCGKQPGSTHLVRVRVRVRVRVGARVRVRVRVRVGLGLQVEVRSLPHRARLQEVGGELGSVVRVSGQGAPS